MVRSRSLPFGKNFKFSEFQTLIADSFTIFWGDWLELRTKLVQIISSGLISPLIYILAFGFGLGSSIKPGSGLSGDYNNYLEFILPGMVALSSMTVSFVGTTFSICGDRLFTKNFEELLLVPVHPLALHIGKMLAGVMRGLMTSLGVILVALVFTRNWNFLNPLFLLILVLSCAVFAGLGVIVGLNVKSLESVGLYNNFIIIPMSFLGATFFDPATLPTALKFVVYLLPLTYASIGLRAAACLPLSQFPWYCLPILLVMAIALSLWGAYVFSHQQD
ncbi:ABC transporter permease [Brasilonema octagenarum UFV-E1]|uniref:Transport permease protein n=1 Tax=Brasilonema sennae CENA114 TaxID=415709 RepID=A0A856MCK8_9CYAN|nr:ABC transporter permease [Brasilonema sennae]QDL09025.1 ABC transporter permease [Brasilonema sennae CENA114]QDL15382.1 ABC transporter permease [Brasilonema octagenarum UFV-E1]